MRSLGDTLAARILGALADAIYRYPRLFFYPQVVLFFVCITYTILGLQFDTSRNNLVGAEKKYHQDFLGFKREFPAQDDLVVVVESEDLEKNRQFVERLGVRLLQETNLLKDVFYKGDFRMLGRKALLFVPEKDLEGMRDSLREFSPFIQQFSRATNLITLFDLVNAQFQTAQRQQNEANDALIKALPVLQRIIDRATDSIQRPGVPPSPGVMAVFGGDQNADSQVYATFANGRIFVATARATSEANNFPALLRLRELVEQTKAEVPGLNVGITGEPVLEHDEMAQSQVDSTVASVVSLVLCALIFIYGYRETGRPIKATACLIVGLAYTMGFTTLSVGHLNILTITFVPILIGLAIDFGVHLITRYEEELRHGRSEHDALHKAMVFTGQGIFTGAVTTAAAFLAMSVTNFKGIQEMGIICGGGMLVCLVPMMTMLPVLLLRGRQNVIDHAQQGEADRRARLERLWLERPWAVTVVTVVFCLLAGLQIRRVYFDYDLRNMQSAGLPAVVFEKKLINSASRSVLFGAVLATNFADALRLEARIRQLPAVATVELGGIDGMMRALTEDQSRKLALITEIKADTARIRFNPPDPEPVRLSDLSRVLYSFYGFLGAAAGATEKEEPALHRLLWSLHQSVETLRVEMLRDAPDSTPLHAAKLGAYQRALFSDIKDTFEAIQGQDDRARLELTDLAPAFRERFVSPSGLWLLQVYPKQDVWKRAEQEDFVRQLRSLDSRNTGHPVVTGTPVQLLEYTELLKNSYMEAAWYALAAIAIMVLMHFRSLACVILALIPVGVGTLWTLGMMGSSNVPFNPANIMTLPLVVGIGVTNGIHILNRFAEEVNPGILAKSTGKAVLVSGLTTIAGFGSLLIAQHQGIRSLGFVMSIGVAMCMVAGLTFLPALLTLLLRMGWKIKRPSGDNALSSLGREEPR